MNRPKLTVNVSDFAFTCPACGVHIEETDQVWTLPVSALVRWPVCAECGLHWVNERLMQS